MHKELLQYKELIKLTQSYLLEEFRESDAIDTNNDAYFFFQQFKNPSSPISQPIKTLNQPFKTSEIYPPLKKVNEIKKESPIIVEKASVPIEEKEIKNFHSFEKTEHHKFSLESLKIKHEIDLSSLKKEIQTLFPHLELIQEPIDDSEARKIAFQWRYKKTLPEVIILSFNEQLDEIQFLQKVALAISEKITPAAHYAANTIEAQQKWQGMFKMKGLKLIIAPDYGIQAFNSLINFYSHQDKTLGGIPLLLLPNLSLYLKQPELKRALWQAICAKLNHCT